MRGNTLLLKPRRREKQPQQMKKAVARLKHVRAYSIWRDLLDRVSSSKACDSSNGLALRCFCTAGGLRVVTPSGLCILMFLFHIEGCSSMPRKPNWPPRVLLRLFAPRAYFCLSLMLLGMQVWKNLRLGPPYEARKLNPFLMCNKSGRHSV